MDGRIGIWKGINEYKGDTMDEKEFFYIDRPSVPAVKQNLIDPEILFEHAIPVNPSDINSDAILYASEVKNANGTIAGTVLYAPYVTYEYVTSVSSDVVTDEGEVEEEIEEEEGEEEEGDEIEVAHDIPPSDVEDTLSKLGLELAEARRRVQQIEADIFDLESGC